MASSGFNADYNHSTSPQPATNFTFKKTDVSHRLVFGNLLENDVFRRHVGLTQERTTS